MAFVLSHGSGDVGFRRAAGAAPGPTPGCVVPWRRLGSRSLGYGASRACGPLSSWEAADTTEVLRVASEGPVHLLAADVGVCTRGPGPSRGGRAGRASAGGTQVTAACSAASSIRGREPQPCVARCLSHSRRSYFHWCHWKVGQRTRPSPVPGRPSQGVPARVSQPGPLIRRPAFLVARSARAHCVLLGSWCGRLAGEDGSHPSWGALCGVKAGVGLGRQSPGPCRPVKHSLLIPRTVAAAPGPRPCFVSAASRSSWRALVSAWTPTLPSGAGKTSFATRQRTLSEG